MGFITKAVEILEKELNNDKPSIAMAMKYSTAHKVVVCVCGENCFQKHSTPIWRP